MKFLILAFFSLFSSAIFAGYKVECASKEGTDVYLAVSELNKTLIKRGFVSCYTTDDATSKYCDILEVSAPTVAVIATLMSNGNQSGINKYSVCVTVKFKD
ncbi:MAG: hypothetical protein A2504_07595 [Bdellovibrionales bacterium RIFOXYD12_FULL_39_22]|nr:MAG: hypothetical protein A2385_10920 [Bdellovibrionales bacterium RIFOXYB1_FULL_39_21]OFZ41305.1 MAG: hypothetical protein A2485_00765 [Bdellovibrionales bacterium RIFOXYC12_FULL_39_17]OFZ45045.1 MAG: hypothetical protein A2404_11215 [Bdellovibrionales bacterium RIFOXYC1_FULL_39_130]OFZ74429.1 MAG: hypothetical protein A2560_11250 [Bdellovibrionales bacterium RIFOXYD1_FULL_39_84]OFZ76705.1 MAG: hypothetical protein A2451_04565 [Bdellovibrionales bacterium RIFOXYC2_FULL_39_8]OFZ92441.1 MAG: